MNRGMSQSQRRLAMATFIASIVALSILLAARIFGPTDVWDQTQPKTVSYTTDIIANGRWILPLERGQFPATKPPLYNWFAAPAVAVFGSTSEFAHKLPSVLALVTCWIVVLHIGKRFATDEQARDGALIGSLAALMLATNYSMFKIGYLARPDMLLVLWTLLGWWAATSILVDMHPDDTSRLRRSILAVAFWLCIALAGLTKGPAVLVLLAYAFFAPRVLAGQWKAINHLQWWWGAPAALGIIGVWVYGAWVIDPQHVYDQLWYAEFYGRVTGTGPEGSRDGLIGLLRTIHLPVFYFVSRFAPWSILSIFAAIALLQRERATNRAYWRSVPGRSRSWLLAVVFFVGMTIGLYMFSSSKKPDYLAAAVPMGALLGAWWIVQLPVRLRSRAVVGVILTSSFTLAAMIGFNIRQPAAPTPEFGSAINAFIDETDHHLRDSNAPVVFCWTGYTHLQAMLGYSMVDDTAAFERQYSIGEPFWVIAGRRKGDPPMFENWVAARRRFSAEVEQLALSAHLPRAFGWPEQVGLYWVKPTPRDEPPR